MSRLGVYFTSLVIAIVQHIGIIMPRGEVVMVKQLANILSPEELVAVKEFESGLRKNFRVVQLKLFGSTAREESDAGSDLDILVVLAGRVTHRIRNTVSDVAFETNLKHGTNISVLVVDEVSWNNEAIQLTPFYSEVVRDGVAIYEA